MGEQQQWAPVEYNPLTGDLPDLVQGKILTDVRSGLNLGDASLHPASDFAKVNDPRIGARTLPAVPVGGSCYTGPLTTNGPGSAGTSRSVHKIGFAGSDLRLVYGNWYVADTPIYGQDADGPNSLTISASIEISGVIYRVTFGGKIQSIIDQGGMVISDPLAFEVNAGDTIYVRTYVNGTYYATRASYTGDGGGFTATTDLTAPGSAAIAASVSWLFAPMAILAKPADFTKSIAVGVVGDSIAVGVNGGGGAFGGVSSNDGGFIARAVDGKAGIVNAGHPSERAATFKNPSAHFRRLQLLSGCTHAVSEYGINDVRNNDNLATIQATMLAVWSLTKNRVSRVLQTTLTPDTQTIDGWATPGNQTFTNAAQNIVRIAFNNWLRNGAPIDPATKIAVAIGTSGALLMGQAGHPLFNYLEIADLIETSRDSGIWKTNGRAVTDGAMTSGSTTLTSATANFTAADVNASVQINGAGTAGANLSAGIVSVTNSTTVVLNTAAATTVAAVITGIGTKGYTIDGLHPNRPGIALMMPGVDLTKFTF